jgi:hypothetical protein
MVILLIIGTAINLTLLIVNLSGGQYATALAWFTATTYSAGALASEINNNLYNK